MVKSGELIGTTESHNRRDIAQIDFVITRIDCISIVPCSYFSIIIIS
jgi:hypothetical protein